MKKLATDGRLNVSQTDCFLSTEIGFENTLGFFGDGPDWLTHPISQVNSVLLRIQLGLCTDVMFKLCDCGIRIKNFFDNCILWNFLEFWL